MIDLLSFFFVEAWLRAFLESKLSLDEDSLLRFGFMAQTTILGERNDFGRWTEDKPVRKRIVFLGRLFAC